MPDLLGLGAPPSGPSAPWQPPGIEFPRVVQVGTVVEDFETGAANTSYTTTSGQSTSGGNGTGTWNYVAASTWPGASGTLCSQLNITASSSWFRTLKFVGGGVTGGFVKATFSYSALPTGATAFLNLQDESNSRAQIATSASGSLLVRDANTTKFTSSYKFQLGVPYTILWTVSGAGTQRAWFYDLYGNLLDDSGDVLFTTGSPLISLRFGSTAAPGVPTTMYYDNVGVSTVGPFAAPAVTSAPPQIPVPLYDPPMVGGNPGDFSNFQWWQDVRATQSLTADNTTVASATLTTDGNLTRLADVATAVTATLTAAASLTRLADTSTVVTATLTADSARTTFADTALTVAAGLTASAQRTANVDETSPITATLSATAVRIANADVAFAATAGLTAAATVVKNVTASAITTATLTATAIFVVGRAPEDRAGLTDSLSVTYTSDGNAPHPPVRPAPTHINSLVGQGQWLYVNATSNRARRPPLAPRKEPPKQ